MLETIRKRQRLFLTIITAVVIVAFAWFYNPTTRTGMGGGPSGVVGKLNGRSITIDQLAIGRKTIFLASNLGMTDMIEQLGTETVSRDMQPYSLAWNLLLLRDQADRLQIAPSPDQVKTTESALSQFQTDGKFDGAKYQQFLTEHGVKASNIDDLVLDHLRFVAISHLINDSSVAPESILRKQFDQNYQKTAFGVIRFNRTDFEAPVSDDEVKKYYDEHKTAFQSPELRKISYAPFLLTDDQKKLPGDQLVAPKKGLAEQANAFFEAVAQNPDSFDEVAKSKGITLKQTDLFSATEPDKSIADEKGLAELTFQLNAKTPIDSVEGSSGFYVVKLTGSEPSRQLTLQEAKDKVIAAVKDEKISAAMQAKAKEVRDKITADIKGGTDFVKAAEAAGYKAETPEPFSMAEPGKTRMDLAMELYQNRVNLDAAQMSPFIPSKEGGLLIYAMKKDPVDEAKYEEFKKAHLATFNQQFQGIAFHEWLKTELKKAGQPALFGAAS
jgi:peptidyl-prolyl cis-trans isomerase D